MMQHLVIERWVPQQVTNGNKGGHWRVKQAKFDEAQQMVWTSAKAAGWQMQPGKVHVHIHFVFPEKRRRDVDNLTARAKGCLDALKRGFIEDDDMEHLTLAVSAEVQKGRKALEITLEGAG